VTSAPGWFRRHPVLLTVPLATALVLVTWMLAFGQGRNPDAYRNPLIGRRAPGFTLTSLRGSEPIRLSEFRGKVVVLNFWASWCNECWAEHEALDKAWRRYRHQGVVVIGVAYQDPETDSREFLRALRPGWPQGRDDGYRTSIAYSVHGVPATVFIARNGTIAAIRPGRVSYSFLSSQISRLL
jgi:cytochrome c biogenesis protein CcmG/thiol:disulfide interchange protein DsbE